jgi:hypothetical protein
MQDWKTVLSAPRFRDLWIALLCTNLGSWCVIASLPILVAERFGAGSELVLSLGMRIVPKILLAPLSGSVLRRFGPARVAATAMTVMGCLTALLPHCRDFGALQILIAAIGMLDVFINPGLLTLRGPATPRGLEMAGNTLCSVADRLGKFGGPAIGGLVVLGGFGPAFLLFGAATALSAIPVFRLRGMDTAEPDAPATRPAWQFTGLIAEFAATLRADSRLVGLLVCAVSYMVMLGGLRPFLFWANRDWFGASDTAWTGLLAAQGAGALTGALISGLFGRRLARLMPAYTLTLTAGLLEGMFHLGLLGASTAFQAMLLLALAGIPEIVSTAAWFTVVQERLAMRRQAVFFALSAPLWDCAYALGVMSAGLHANGTLSLSTYWAFVSLTSTLPIVPLLIGAGGRRWRLVTRPPGDAD